VKAIRYDHYGGPEVLDYAEVAEPEPGPGEVLVDMRAASVNPVDWKIRAGLLQKFFPMEMPVIPGRDGSGIVAALGDGVTGWQVGDAACFVAGRTNRGTCAQRAAIDAGLLIAKPARVGHDEAAAFPLAGLTAWTALVETADVRRSQRVLIHAGAGGVGGIAIQLARHLGAEVAATCSAANLDYVRRLGADPAIAYDREDFATRLDDYDVVLDSIGGAVHRRSYEVLKPGGTLVYLIADPIEDLSERYGVTTRLAVIQEDRDRLAAVAALVESGAIVPQVGQVLPLAEAAAAHRLSESGNARGKIVLQVR